MFSNSILQSLRISKYCIKTIVRRNSHIPNEPVNAPHKITNNYEQIDSETIVLLEKLSLVKCDTNEGKKILEHAVAFANNILNLPTEDVAPLYTVLEHETLHLREDKIDDGYMQTDILKNAVLTEEEYFVAPPGNISVEISKIDEDKSSLKN